MNGHRFRVWVGRDGIMFVSCFSVSIVMSGFSCAAQSLRCPLWDWCVEQIYRGIQIHTSPVADTPRFVQHKKSHS